MLKTVELTGKRNRENGCVMLLGGFDGLHVGHKKLVSRALSYGLPVGIMTIVGGKAGESLFTLREREESFKAAGIDFVFELPFSEIRDIPPEEFAKILVDGFAPKAFVCGDDFRFGAKAGGTPELLERTTHVCVHVEELVKVDGEKVSTTTLKKLLSLGEVARANALLGGEYFLFGEVFADRKIGRTIGFPTANVAYPQGKFPLKQGVYETWTEVDGKRYKGITNYGSRPTFGNDTTLTETHLCGFAGDLYGRELHLRFVRFLRDVRKFESVAALKEQLQKDIRRVQAND